jgi:hypothetical protein
MTKDFLGIRVETSWEMRYNARKGIDEWQRQTRSVFLC